MVKHETEIGLGYLSTMKSGSSYSSMRKANMADFNKAKHAHWEITTTLHIIWHILNENNTRGFATNTILSIFSSDLKWIKLFEYEESKHG